MNVQSKRETLEKIEDLLTDILCEQRQIESLESELNGEFCRVFDSLTPKWEHKLEIKRNALKRLYLRYNNLVTKL